MVKKAYFTNIKKMIFQSKARFFSIFSIVFLGAAFFAGLRNTPGVMQVSMSQYLQQHHIADLTYMSSLGLSEEDVQLVRDIEEVEEVSCGYQFDAQIMLNEKLSGIQVYTNQSYSSKTMNSPELIEGTYPTQSHECLIDKNLLSLGVGLGDKIEIRNNQGEKTFTIVGIINDVRYISATERGTNQLGDGTNSGFIEILTQENGFLALPSTLNELRNEKILYNQICVRVKKSKNYLFFSDEYDEFIENVNTKIKSQLSLKLSDIYDELTLDAQSQLDDSRKQYETGYATYITSKESFETQILKAKIQLTQAKIQINQNEQKILKAEQSAYKETTQSIDTLSKNIQELEIKLEKLKQELEKYSYTALPSQEENLSILLSEIDNIQKTLSSSQTAIDGLEQLTLAKIQIEEAKLQLQQQENQLNIQELTTRNQLDKAKSELDQAKEQLDEAQENIDQIPKGQLYTLTRHENAGLVNYSANIESITSIAAVFPLIFFLVSALVSLTTMTRMVEEQRSQNGTLRALGYSKKDIVMQYVIYVLLATFIASVLGIIVGIQVFPRIIYYLYTYMLFTVGSKTVIVSDTTITLLTIFISVIVTLAVTLYICIAELNDTPAVLMRPKAPKLGKRILLEKMTFLWKKLSFNQKVTMRNIFRYKKRFFMSIIGIAGCTALIITGFGIKYSVSEVVERQYKNVLKYDAFVRLEDNISVNESKTYQQSLLKREEVNNIEYVYNQSIEILGNKQDLYGTLVVYQSMDNMQNFITFKDMKHKKINLDDEGIVLSVKTAELLNVEAGDYIDLEISGMKYNVQISAVMENYFMHYVYMSQTLYESITSQSLQINSAYMTMKDVSSAYKKTIETYMNHKNYGHLSFIDTAGDDFHKQVQSLDMVVFILIICAGALNFIVLYNLTNINVQERKSEIATIKVLGFRRKEVYDYIFRENIILSIIGSLVGVILGYLLHRFIVLTVELEMTMFVRQLNLFSYLISIVITIGFTIMINFFMRRVLNKVNMVESLKSVE